MQNYKRLKVWSRAHELTLAVYRATSGFPVQERYGLTSQIRRAAASIPANIAEGCGRRGSTELAHFLSIALGSANELEYHLLLARDLELLSAAKHRPLTAGVVQVQRMLAALIGRVASPTGS